MIQYICIISHDLVYDHLAAHIPALNKKHRNKWIIFQKISVIPVNSNFLPVILDFLPVIC